jgi:hypothetical protein
MMSVDESNGPEAAPVVGLKRPVVMPDIYKPVFICNGAVDGMVSSMNFLTL